MIRMNTFKRIEFIKIAMRLVLSSVLRCGAIFSRVVPSPMESRTHRLSHQRPSAEAVGELIAELCGVGPIRPGLAQPRYGHFVLACLRVLADQVVHLLRVVFKIMEAVNAFACRRDAGEMLPLAEADHVVREAVGAEMPFGDHADVRDFLAIDQGPPASAVVGWRIHL